MKIGLYSWLARREVRLQRELISSSEEIRSPNEVKKARQKLIADGAPRVLLDSPDFYSVSEVRDLLYHVQEHQFSIPEIKSALAELRIEFCGFLFSNNIIPKGFVRQFSSEDSYDLDLWAAFEENNPDCFASMYQFYCQKL